MPCAHESIILSLWRHLCFNLLLDFEIPTYTIQQQHGNSPLVAKKMTSWHDLPFELKSHKFVYYLEASVPNVSDEASYSSGRFTSNVLSFLNITPELKDDAFRAIDAIIERRLRLHTDFDQRLEVNAVARPLARGQRPTRLAGGWRTGFRPFAGIVNFLGICRSV